LGFLKRNDNSIDIYFSLLERGSEFALVEFGIWIAWEEEEFKLYEFFLKKKLKVILDLFMI